eukprot:TRINITY_DN5286_c0_g2_i17.p1 TRINITY_DN5286_c0_g2~~TRINITY_DN5286_c0_g2_i17.p1  ORF type:complete len:527 (+),score=89.18 TRINITY_DN5286_c0_g2_i17:525-2105(+)
MKIRPASKLDINEYVQVKLIKPHPLWSKRWYCYYFRALLWLSDRDEGLREQFWGILLDLMIRLDTCVFWNHIQDQQAVADVADEEEQSRNPDEFGQVFDLDWGENDGEDLDEKQKSKNDKSDLPVIAQKSWSDLQASSVLISFIQADKLDVLLEMVFHFINKWEQKGEIMDIWRMMIYDFDKLLTAAECKFVTYLIFHIINKRPERFGPEFLELLWQKFEVSGGSANVRRYCTSYISSFLCRSKLCPREMIFTYIQRMLKWIKMRLPQGHYNLDGQFISDSENYALFRGLLLILCYNMKPIFLNGSSSQQNQLRSMIENDLVEIAEHPASLFQFTNNSVVQEFIDQTKSLKLPDFSKYFSEDVTEAVLKQQKKTQLRFPFDPFLLEQSSKHLNLDQTYVKFQSVKSLFQDDEPEENNQEEQEKLQHQQQVEDEQKISGENNQIIEIPIEEQLMATTIGGDSVEFVCSPGTNNIGGTPLGGSPMGTSPAPLNNYFDRLGERCQEGTQSDVHAQQNNEMHGQTDMMET